MAGKACSIFLTLLHVAAAGSLDVISRSLVLFHSDYEISSKLLSSSNLSHMLRFFQPRARVSSHSSWASQPGGLVLSSSLHSPPAAIASELSSGPVLTLSHELCKLAAAPLCGEWRMSIDLLLFTLKLPIMCKYNK